MKKILMCALLALVSIFPVAANADPYPYDVHVASRAIIWGETDEYLIHATGSSVVWFNPAVNRQQYLNFGTGLVVTQVDDAYQLSTPALSFSYPTRALDTCFQVSATRNATVAYGVDVATVSTLAAGQAGTVFLEIFTDDACTADTQEVMRFTSGAAQTDGLDVTLSKIVTGRLNGTIPAGAYVKLRTQNTTGTPTFTARPGQEVLI